MNFLPSLRFAVINLIHLAFISAIGAVIESYWDRELARLLIYDSIWMMGALFLLSVNLTAVLVSRWPWRKKHIPFVTAHFGLLILIAGSLITKLEGVDGSMRLAPGEKVRSITLSSQLLTAYGSFDGENMTELYRAEPRFRLRNFFIKKPYTFSLGEDLVSVTRYEPYTKSIVRYRPDEGGGLFVQFLLEGQRASTAQKLFKKKSEKVKSIKAGPAQVTVRDRLQKPAVQSLRNELVLIPQKKNQQEKNQMSYTLSSKGQIKKGLIKKGQKIKTGWMDLHFHLIDFYKAQEIYKFHPQKKPDENTIPAIKVQLGDEARWMGLNSFLSFYKKDKAMILGYMNQKQSIGSEIKLKHFNIKRYPSSLKAKSYESLVLVDGKREVLISMNEPLRHKGWTFYQSSFEEDEKGEILASILSVNRDPGRFVKYFGCILIVLGIFGLFASRKIPF